MLKMHYPKPVRGVAHPTILTLGEARDGVAARKTKPSLAEGSVVFRLVAPSVPGVVCMLCAGE